MALAQQKPLVLFSEHLSVPKSTPLTTYEVLDHLSFLEACRMESDPAAAWLRAERSLGLLSHHFLWKRDGAFSGTRDCFLELLTGMVFDQLAGLEEADHERRMMVAEGLRFFRVLHEACSRDPDAGTLEAVQRQGRWLRRPLGALLRAMCSTAAAEVEPELEYFVQRLVEGDAGVYTAFAAEFEALCATLCAAHKWHQPLVLAAVKAVVRGDEQRTFVSHINCVVRSVQTLADRGAAEAPLVACLKHWVAAKLSELAEQQESTSHGATGGDVAASALTGEAAVRKAPVPRGDSSMSDTCSYELPVQATAC